MDPVRFDTLVKTLATPGTRRGLLRLLGSVPIASGLLTVLDPAGVAGKDGKHGKGGKGGNGGRGGKGGHGRHGHKGGKGKNRSTTSQGCLARSDVDTCANQCGTVLNNCQKPVTC